MAAPLIGLTKKDNFICCNDCEQAFLTFKKSFIQPSILAYQARDGSATLSIDTSNTGMGAVLEQEQRKDVRVAKGVIACAPKRLTGAYEPATLPIENSKYFQHTRQKPTIHDSLNARY